MATPAAAADAPPASTQLPPASAHAGQDAAGESAGSGSSSAQGGHDNGSGAPDKKNGSDDDSETGAGSEGNEKSPGKTGSSEKADSDVEMDSAPDEPAPEASSAKLSSSKAPQASRQGKTAQPAPSGKIASLLTLEEVARHVQKGNLPPCRARSTGHLNTRPTTRTVPPQHIEDGASFIVGVPADAHTLRECAFVQDGYAGTESLMMFHGLSTRDIESLVDLVGDRTEVHELILRPYLTQARPDTSSLEMMVSSLAVRREMASVGSHMSLYGFAQRLFYTLSLLHRTLERDRQRESLIRDGSDAAKMLKLQTQYDQLKSEYKLLDDYYQREVQSARDRASELKGVLEHDFQQMASENLHEVDALRDQVPTLSSQLEVANKRVHELESRLKEGTFNGSDLLAYLNEGDSEVRGNWPRLARVLRCYQNGVKPPSSWKTWITVDAADKRSRWVPAYPDDAPADSDDNEDLGDNIADEEPKTEEKPPSSGDDTVDMTGDGSSSESPPPTPKGSRRASRRSSTSTVSSTPDKVTYQRLPSTLVASKKSPRPVDAKLPYSIKDCCQRLPEFVAWEHLRRDVQLTMLAGLGYAKAVERMGRDKPAHHLFFRRDLLEMLATMMYRQCLDSTPWSKYVQERYYSMAATVVEKRLTEQGPHPDWPVLANIAEEMGFIEGGADDVDEDHSSDDNYDDKEERRAKKQARRERSKSQGSTVKRKSPSKSSKGTPTAPSPGSSADSDSDNKDVRPPRRKRKVASMPSSSDTDNEDPPKGGVFTPSSSKKRPSRLSASGSAKKTRANMSRAELDRLKSPLAKKSYKSLTPEELAVIEVPAHGILSWRRRGILTGYSPKKGNHTSQTPGFPDYAPIKGETHHLARRWMAVEQQYLKLLTKTPWVKMFNQRVKVLYFHERSKLTSTQKDLLDEYVKFVRDNAQAFYDVLHWITMKTKPAKDEDCADPSIYNSSAGLSTNRAARRDKVDRTFTEYLESLFARGLPRSMVHEPGFWVYPVKICHLYLTDPTTLNKKGEPYSLKQQIRLAEKDEPVRTQFTRYCTDFERLAAVPADIRRRLIKQRATNWVSEVVQDL